MEFLAMRLVPVLSRLTELHRYESLSEPLRLEARQVAQRLHDQALLLLARPEVLSGVGQGAMREAIEAVDAALESAGSDPNRLAEAIVRAVKLERTIEEYLRPHAAM